MNILGISGLEQAMPFKRTHWPGLDVRDYRISQGHDAAAALVVDGSRWPLPPRSALTGRNTARAFPRAPSFIAWTTSTTCSWTMSG
jgi:carbamoyltransferase